MLLAGLINNVLYVVILAAAQDLVGNNVPKGVVLLADVMPSFIMKLFAPYFIHKIPYVTRVLICCALSSAGMLMLAFTPRDTQSIAVKLVGVVFASLSSGGGELSFLGLTHYYGSTSLAAWGGGTGAAGLAGSGMYVTMTESFGFSVKKSLLISAFLPAFMLLSFFVILPRGPLEHVVMKEYVPVPEHEPDEQRGTDEEEGVVPLTNAAPSLLTPPPASRPVSPRTFAARNTFFAHVKRAEKLFVPYMIPLFMVYVSEYTINQGVAPTLIFPLPSSPFTEYRSFYPFYSFLYQLGVFVSRSSTPFFRIHRVYVPSMLQVVNLVFLTLQAFLNFVPSVYLIFIVIFWEGLLGGAVYVNTFAEIMENVPYAEREFSLSSASVSDSAGIVTAGFIGMAMEVWLCDWQAARGRDYCKRIEATSR